MKAIIKVLIITAFLFSCKNNCNIDTEFEEKFKNSIEIIRESNLNKNGKPIDIYKIRDAFIFLTAVTKITTTEIKLDDGLYYRDEDCKRDIKLWERWYEKHKCDFSIELADSLYYNFEFCFLQDSINQQNNKIPHLQF